MDEELGGGQGSSMQGLCYGNFTMEAVHERCSEIKTQQSSVEPLSPVGLFIVTPWTAAHKASLSITNSQSFDMLKLMSLSR